MNINDVKVAIAFLYETEEPDYVVLQCKDAKAIPYVKRAVFQTLGEPSKILTHDLHYGNKTLRIRPVTLGQQAFLGTPETKLFYIAFKDNNDWLATMREPSEVLPYMITPWFNHADMYTALIRQGANGDDALDAMRYVPYMEYKQ